MSETAGRVTGYDHAGRPVVRYQHVEVEGRRSARGLEVLGPGAEDHVLESLSGWTVQAPEALGRRLLAAGASLRRHAHRMRWTAATAPPPPLWSDPRGVRPARCDRSPADVFPAWRAAYEVPGHPDAFGRTDDEALHARLLPLLRGEEGEVLPWSRLGVAPDGRVVGGVVVIDLGIDEPWIGDVWREPGPAHAGLGGRLLAHVLALAAADGTERVGLAVTDGNPARRVYEALGFRRLSTTLTVVLP